MTIRKSVRVERSPEIAFRVFCEEMSKWWPEGFGGKEAKPFLEGRVGGRFFERRPDGTEYQIGEVTAYQPPSVVAFTWRAPSWDVHTQWKSASSPKAVELVSSWSIVGGDRTRRLATPAKATTRDGRLY
jgi:uncharacterized protein YndB with AHSA1/START domain